MFSARAPFRLMSPARFCAVPACARVQKLRTWVARSADIPAFQRYGARHVVWSWDAVASPSVAYQPRIPVQDVLYQVVRDHFETFRAQAASLRDGEGLPRFVEEDFRAFLRCGCLAGRLRASRSALGRADEAQLGLSYHSGTPCLSAPLWARSGKKALQMNKDSIVHVRTGHKSL